MPLEISAFSACSNAGDRETHKHIWCTHSGDLGSEIINANRAALAREGREAYPEAELCSYKKKPARREGMISVVLSL